MKPLLTVGDSLPGGIAWTPLAHTLPVPSLGLPRENGQLVLLRVPGS